MQTPPPTLLARALAHGQHGADAAPCAATWNPVGVINNAAPEGKELKYGNRERERRFLLAAPPAGPVVRTGAITDRYITGTRLRLRRVEWTGGGEGVVYKLTQKVPHPDGRSGLITTIYLTAEEYRVFARLPATPLRKLRHSVPPLGVDLFEGELDGLVLAEVEFPSDDALADFTPPPIAVAEVTEDERFTGGHLITATRAEIAVALAEYGIAIALRRAGHWTSSPSHSPVEDRGSSALV